MGFLQVRQYLMIVFNPKGVKSNVITLWFVWLSINIPINPLSPKRGAFKESRFGDNNN